MATSPSNQLAVWQFWRRLRMDALEATQFRQRLSDLCGQRFGLVAPQIDDLLGHAQLGVAGRQLEKLAPALAGPAELDRAPDLRRVATHRCARFLQLRRELFDAVGIAAP